MSNDKKYVYDESVSDTPRTDATSALHSQGVLWVSIYFARELERELNAANADRDEARREVCSAEADVGFCTAREIAAERGWDCFDEK